MKNLSKQIIAILLVSVFVSSPVWATCGGGGGGGGGGSWGLSALVDSVSARLSLHATR